MRDSVSLHTLLTSLLVLLICTSANAGFLDNAINKIKQATEAETAGPSSLKAAADSGSPEPTPGASMLAAVHFLPHLLDDELTLKRVLLTVHPDAQSVVNNEFQWHKRKDELRDQLLKIVYQYEKNVTYMLDRLPEGTSVSSLQQRYHDEFVGKVAGARYTYTAANGWMHFDDSSPPPYNRKITTRHARIILSEAKKAGRFAAGMSIEWKQPVGASW